MKPRKVPFSVMVVIGPSAPTKVPAVPPPATITQSFPPTPTFSDQAQTQHWTKVHRSGSSTEAEQNAKKREPRHVCIFLSPVSYFLFAPGHEVCIRLGILEEHECHGKWQRKANEWSRGYPPEHRREWNKRKPGKRENGGMWGHTWETHLAFAESASTPSLTSHTLAVLEL